MGCVLFTRVRKLRSLYTLLVLFACRPGANADTDCPIHGPAVWNIHYVSGCVEEAVWGMNYLNILVMYNTLDTPHRQL